MDPSKELSTNPSFTSIKHPSFFSRGDSSGGWSSFSSFPTVDEIGESDKGSNDDLNSISDVDSEYADVEIQQNGESNTARTNNSNATPKASQRRARPSSATTSRRKVSREDAEKFYGDVYGGQLDASGNIHATKRSERPQSAKQVQHSQSDASLQTYFESNESRKPAIGGRPRSAKARASAKAKETPLPLLRTSGRDRKYEQLRKKEQGWDSTFVLSHALDEENPVSGSGFRALRRKAGRPKSTGVDGRRKGDQAETNGNRKRKIILDETLAKFQSFKKEIATMWAELHIPERDRDFFRESYFNVKRSKLQPHVLEKLQEHIELLLDHKHATLEVLDKIETREEILNHLRQIVVMKRKNEISSKHVNLPNSIQVLDPEFASGSEPAPLIPLSGKQHSTTRAILIQELVKPRLEDVSQDEIAEFVKLLRISSLTVVNSILEWRKVLWRPHPFMWQGVNYLIKMQNDLRFFRKRMDTALRDLLFLEDCTIQYADKSQRGDIAKARSAVEREMHIQCELKAENARLLKAGYYIPMLRWSPETSGQMKQSIPTSKEETRDADHQALSPTEQTREESDLEYSTDFESEDQLIENKMEACLRASHEHLDLLRRIREQIHSS